MACPESLEETVMLKVELLVIAVGVIPASDVMFTSLI